MDTSILHQPFRTRIGLHRASSQEPDEKHVRLPPFSKIIVGTVVKARAVTDYYTRQSKGFGYVVMAEQNAGVQAIQAMNGKMINARPLVVNEARPRDERLGQGW